MKVKRLIIVTAQAPAVVGLDSPDGAAQLAGAFLLDTLASCARVEVGADMWVIPNANRELPADMPKTARVVAADPTMPLSARFDTAFADGYGFVCAVAAHLPHLPSAFLQEAMGRLAASPVTGAGVDLVCGATDGGECYLVALRGSFPDLFGDAVTPEALRRETIETRAQAAGVGYHWLPRSYPVKAGDDLRRLQRDLGRGVAFAPRTAKVLDSLRL